MLWPMPGKISAWVPYARAVRCTSSTEMIPSRSAPRTSTGTPARAGCARTKTSMSTKARKDSSCTRAWQSLTTSSVVSGVKKSSRTSAGVATSGRRRSWRIAFSIATGGEPPAGRPLDPPRRRDRRHEHRSPHDARVQMLLCQQPAHRVPNQDGGHGELRRRASNVVEVVVDPMPDTPSRVVAAQPHRPDVVADVGQPGGEVVPAPRAVPGPVDKQDAGHLLGS